jgi:hypothetical protein
MKKSEGRKPYTFYDGPPFATGTPHYGHIAAGTIKVSAILKMTPFFFLGRHDKICNSNRSPLYQKIWLGLPRSPN